MASSVPKGMFTAVEVRKHRDTLMAARTHGQQAIPVTLGYKVAVWIDEVRFIDNIVL